MPYDYAEHRPFVFTEEGQVMFLRIRDRAHCLLDAAGAVRCDKLMAAAGSGCSWDMLACIDRLVELKELREITDAQVAGQHRVFVSNNND